MRSTDRTRRARLGLPAALLVAAVVVGVLAARPTTRLSGVVLVAPAADPVALVALPDGGLLYAERLSGRVRRVDAADHLDPRPFATVAVATAGEQRGLLGLTRTPDGRVFAAWTRPGDLRLVVGRLDAGAGTEELVWRGPVSTTRATGGHLATAPDGRLLIGVGSLLEGRAVGDPSTPNGKLLLLDPDGPPAQRPEVLVGGWNNPFGFVVTDAGEIWVADNAPPGRPERLARVGDERAPAELAGTRVPSALVELGPGRMGLCGYLSGVLEEVVVDEGGRPHVGRPIGPCATGAARLADGRVVTATADALLVVART